jgi:hypothetical protein
MGYVYLPMEKGLWTVGFFGPSGQWYPESDHGHPEDAAKRVSWLNGGLPLGAKKVTLKSTEFTEDETEGKAT